MLYHIQNSSSKSSACNAHQVRDALAVMLVEPMPDFLARGALKPDVEIAVDALVFINNEAAETSPKIPDADIRNVRIPLGVSSQFVAQDVKDPPADFRAFPKIAGQFVGVDVLGELDQVLLVHDVSFR